MDIITLIDWIGTFVFAISGAFAARERKIDAFGAAVIAFVTAVGGGTIRDVLIGSTPVNWMQDLSSIYCIGLGILAVIFFRNFIQKLPKTMFLFDAIGIGLFTILGIQKTLNFGLSPIIALMMGVCSAVFGGVVRDVLLSRVPLIFREEIYATACLFGGILFLILQQLSLPNEIQYFVPILFIIVLRILAVKKKWFLPEI